MAKATKLLHSQADVREELREVRFDILRSKSRHINAFAERHDTPVMAKPFGSIAVCGKCHVCEGFDHQIWGLDLAIRHFGGRRG